MGKLEMPVDLTLKDLSKCDRVYFTYRGYGPKWVYSCDAVVVKVNTKTVKIEILYSGEKLYFNVHPSELRKL